MKPLLLALPSLVAMAAAAQPAATGFLARKLTVGERDLRYQVYIPTAYTPRQSWPVVLFLHGSGERGSDNAAQLREGMAPAIRAHAHWFPLIAVFPQAAQGARWRDATEGDVLRILDAVEREWPTDRDRTYVVGMSMGGYGTWQLAMDHPGRFAAIVPVCAGVLPPPRQPELLGVKVTDPAGDPYAQIARAVARLPIWMFHGAEDPVVPVNESRRMARELAALGASPRYTEYPFVGHDAWDPTFNTPDLWQWLLKQRRAAGAAGGGARRSRPAGGRQEPAQATLGERSSEAGRSRDIRGRSTRPRCRPVSARSISGGRRCSTRGRVCIPQRAGTSRGRSLALERLHPSLRPQESSAPSRADADCLPLDSGSPTAPPVANGGHPQGISSNSPAPHNRS